MLKYYEVVGWIYHNIFIKGGWLGKADTYTHFVSNDRTKSTGKVGCKQSDWCILTEAM